ncbi:MAG: aldo/keto reductase [Pseudomonadales bacterium]|nr:aldo/keto reductase [Pseudomonadales bacterium]
MIAVRNIGATDIEVTELSFGGAPVGAVGDRLTDDEAAAIVRRARDGGIRYFDTAPLYGHGLSEKRLGPAAGRLRVVHQGGTPLGAAGRGRALRRHAGRRAGRHPLRLFVRRRSPIPGGKPRAPRSRPGGHPAMPRHRHLDPRRCAARHLRGGPQGRAARPYATP